MENYYEQLMNVLEYNQSKTEINEVSKLVAKCIEKDGIIYLFGCGHSHIFGEEFFFRAGGLANVIPILYEPLMLHKGAMQSSVNEKKNGYTTNFITNYEFTENDIIFVISTSGINPVPIDVAIYAKKHNCKVVTISSYVYKEIESSRHKEGLYLSDIGHINIDNGVKHGDAVCTTRDVTHSPISTVVGITILHTIISNGINQAQVETLPIFISGNISGSKEHNQMLVKKYQERIPMLSLNLEFEV